MSISLSPKNIDTEGRTNQNRFSFIRGFQESTLIDWDGKIASIIFLGGCNLKCGFCHSKVLVEDVDSTETTPFHKIAEFLEEKKGWIDGVVITGGEPSVHGSSLIKLVAEIKAMGFQVKLDTNGTNPALLKEIIDNHIVDYIAMDIKAPLCEREYRDAARCGVDIKSIILSKDIILNSDIDYEFRTTIVPGIINQENIISIAKTIKNAKKYCLQQFVPRDTLNPDFMLLKPYSIEDIYKMADSITPYVKNTVVRPN
jgi:pyruvate formate lyase activating enzyme